MARPTASKDVRALMQHVSTLREALTQVKVDYLNKKATLPMTTHAALENALAKTSSVQLSDGSRTRVYAQPRFKIKQHRSPESLVLAFITGPKTKKKLRIEDVVIGVSGGKGDEEFTGQDYAFAVRDMGLWGFTETKKSPPVIHYWHDGKCSLKALTHFFGHEMGHNAGIAEPDGWPEENRADDYGHIAVLAHAAALKAARTG